MASKAVAPVKKAPAKKQAAKKVPSTPKAKPQEIVKHPFGTCVPLGECICNNKGEK